jgi:hypothetical protein
MVAGSSWLARSLGRVKWLEIGVGLAWLTAMALAVEGLQLHLAAAEEGAVASLCS